MRSQQVSGSVAAAGASGRLVGFLSAGQRGGFAGAPRGGGGESLVDDGADGEGEEVVGGEARVMLNAERTGGAAWMGRFREDPGFMTGLHYHPHTDEQVYVLEGTLSVYTDGAWHELEAGTLGLLPKGKPHAQGNRSDKPVHLLGSGQPAAFAEQFPAVDALMKRMQPGTPEFMAEFKKIMQRCGTVPLGPAPA
ncbi:MAG TPA: cupin domain-containing protein [Acidobacteriaceae bacterium]|nr:cupin domain-containing protein [Acidobacteriaceae bacterium]